MQSREERCGEKGCFLTGVGIARSRRLYKTLFRVRVFNQTFPIVLYFYRFISEFFETDAMIGALRGVGRVLQVFTVSR